MIYVEPPPRQNFFYSVRLPAGHCFEINLRNRCPDVEREVLGIGPFLPLDYLKKANSGKDGVTA